MIQNGIEYWHLVDKLQRAYMLLLDENSIKESNSPLYISAYIIRKEVVERMIKYEWDEGNQIAAPMIPGVKTLGEAVTKVLEKLQNISINEVCYDEVEDILAKGKLFYELDGQLSELN